MANIPSAGYMTIQNKSRKEVSIQSISSPAFEDVSWHETFVSEEGIARMRMKKKATVIPAFGEVVLKKGGQHLMLYAALKELEKESEIDLIFKLRSGLEQSFPVKIIRTKNLHNHH